MELHHKLRRDPNWHPSACNICGQLGHQAANCTNGTINWKQIYGEEAFILRPPVYWSEIEAKQKAKRINVKELEERACSYAKTRCESLGVNYEEMLEEARNAVQANGTVQHVAVKEEPAAAAAATTTAAAAAAEEELPQGWAAAQDAHGRTYYWHKKTQKTQWERPTTDTPTE